MQGFRLAMIVGALGAAGVALEAGADPLNGGAKADVAPIVSAPYALVSDEIVVVFDEETAARVESEVEAAARRGGASIPSSVVTIAQSGEQAIDELGQVLGVRALRKQFAGASSFAARGAGLPDLSGYYVVRFDPALATPEEAVEAYRATPGVIHAEVIGIHRVDATPNDSSFASQWHLHQASDRDIDAPEGWEIETGDAGVIMAIIDTGVRYYHKDLGGSAASESDPSATSGNIWINTAEMNGVVGVDDDGNGFLDDWLGWDFVESVSSCWSGEDCTVADNDPRDFNGHGTHCSGIAAALNNNGYGVSSPAGGWGNGTQQPTGNGVKVMALRAGWSADGGGHEQGLVRMDYAASAFVYAAAKGARIASCSWGSSNSGGLGAAVSFFVASGGLVFKGAGNANTEGVDYLCSRSDVYCVAATDQSDAKAGFSSYGTWVDISAPGVAILSTAHDRANPSVDAFAAFQGTSMACPLAASVAASVWSLHPGWTAGQVWARVRDTADNIDAQNPGFIGKLGSGRVNLYRALDEFAGACPGSGDCCTANGSAGCGDDECCRSVCEADAFCCTTVWDATCASRASELCEACAPSTCASCPDEDFAPAAPTTSWQTHSSNVVESGACRLYRFALLAGQTYTFKTGCGDGATAGFDTVIEGYSAGCAASSPPSSNDGCESQRSRLVFTAQSTGDHYIRVRGFTSSFGSYTLAYRQEPPSCGDGTCNAGETCVSCPEDCACGGSCSGCPLADHVLDAPTSSWKFHASFVDGASGCVLYEVALIAGRVYTFQTGCGGGAQAAFDSVIDGFGSSCLSTSPGTNDDGCESGRSLLTFAAASTGVHYLRVRGRTSSDFGAYVMLYRQEPACGDGQCNGFESCGDCAQDCGVCPPFCGDGACNGGETCATCAADCGACPPAAVVNPAGNGGAPQQMAVVETENAAPPGCGGPGCGGGTAGLMGPALALLVWARVRVRPGRKRTRRV